ncbi:MAG: ATP-dependent Clp protease ATP-binding subunit [Candidatus Pacebacteria bacterium]|nr:ATP-dependent Clp protease ATP-binding subunit [Candidatus Paceibacterota bacterium]
MNQPTVNFYFSDLRLKMTHLGRVLVRIAEFTTYMVMIAACALFVVSDTMWLRWAGILLFLFLLDKARHSGFADKSLQENKLSGNVNLAKYLTPSSFAIFEYAFERSLIFGGDFYLLLLRQLSEKKDIHIGLIRMGVDPKKLLEKTNEMLKESMKNKVSDGKNKKDLLTAEIAKISALSLQQAYGVHNRFIEPKDIFAALSYCESPSIANIFQYFNISAGDLENSLVFSRYLSKFGLLRFLPSELGGFVRRPYKVRHRAMNRAWSAKPTPTLDQYSEDLTDLARMEKVGFLIGHRIEYDRMTDILSRPGRQNVLLIGEPGSGKEALLAHLAYRMVKDEVPEALFDKRLVSLQIGNLTAGAEQSEIQNRLKRIIEEIVSSGNVVLIVSDIHDLARISGKENYNILNMLLPAMSSSAFSVVGTTNPREYKSFIEPNADLVKVFESINIQEISAEEATKLLVYDSIILERQYRITITYGAVKEAVNLAKKYFREKLLPSSAQELLRESLADAKEKRVRVLTADDIIDIAQRRINVPLRKAGEQEAEKLLNMEETIHERLIDQEEAVKAVSRALREYRSGLSRKGGPIASFLFVGPTGVGKTELSKILANIQFGSKDAMIRFDMSEYQDKQSVFRFIGSPDGNVSGALTESVSQKPFSLVLLDEFEKAHPDILNLFLQVLDDGRLTDNFGKTIDFQNTVIIATSNAHSEFIKTELEAGRPMSEVAENLKKKLTEIFRPELVNRFSGVIVFKNLSQEDILAVARISLNDLSKEVKESQTVELEFSDEAVIKIAEWGYDPVFGARPLRGVISDKIRSVLAEKILKGEITRGKKIMVKLESNELIFYVG